MKISSRTQEKAIRENVLDYTRRAYQKSLKTGKLNGKYFPDGSPLLTLNSREVDIFKTEEGYRVDYSCGNQL